MVTHKKYLNSHVFVVESDNLAAVHELISERTSAELSVEHGRVVGLQGAGRFGLRFCPGQTHQAATYIIYAEPKVIEEAERTVRRLTRGKVKFKVWW